MSVGLLNATEMETARRRERCRLMAVVVLVAAGGAVSSVFPTVGQVLGFAVAGLVLVAPLVWALRILPRAARRMSQLVPVTAQQHNNETQVGADRVGAAQGSTR